MSTLTEAMTRLSGEIVAMRRGRRALLKEVARATANRRAEVAEMRTSIAKAHAYMARRTKADRMNFLSDLRRTAAGRRREFRADLAGAHQAWLAVSASPAKPKAFLERDTEPAGNAEAEPDDAARMRGKSRREKRGG